MEINEKDITYIERSEIYDNYCEYIEPIIDYMVANGYEITSSYDIMTFIDNIAYNGYGFYDYQGNLYYCNEVIDEAEDTDENYYIEDGQKYILIPIE